MSTAAMIPLRFVGPIWIRGQILDEEVDVPLATFESPLWPSVGRGAKISRLCGGIQVTVVDDRMTRSVVFEAPTAASALEVAQALALRRAEMQAVISERSRFTLLQNLHSEMVGNLLYLRFEYQTGDASGHNMVTQASDDLMAWILANYPNLQYVSISANLCVDKKVSAINGILGRGKYVTAEITLSAEDCETYLHTTPQKMANLNLKKNLIGSILAGSLRSANAHYANMLLATYLATGQDAANIVEGSQGITRAEVREGGLYFSVTLPNLIVGTVGNGKHLEFVRENLARLGCDREDRPLGENAKRLAAIIGATVLCGEISLLAAQTNPGELMQAHHLFERGGDAK